MPEFLPREAQSPLTGKLEIENSEHWLSVRNFRADSLLYQHLSSKAMKNLPRIMFLTGALSLLLLFAFPLWQITLYAPQYPDGITMYIWINQISGNEEGVLQNINILNHYIGMQYIEPDAIPELQYFPYIVIGMCVLGVVMFFVNKRQGFLAWSIMLIVLGILGIYDFYLWEYDYGHNLSPDAPIKIPGMVYQPPLFGQKMLLNFDAHSYPYWGSLFLGLAIVLGLAASWLKWRKLKKSKVTSKPVFAVLALLLFSSSCSVEPQPISYGEDHCHYCQMTIVDQQHGSELVTTTGKVYKFDAVECMIHYMKSGQVEKEKIAQTLVTPYQQRGQLIPVAQAYFLRSEQMPSPMGMNLTAFDSKQGALEFRQEKTGELYSWEELYEQFDTLAPLKNTREQSLLILREEVL
ncbi:nitrous oxide reductase accessory protein NosL [Catalinimonas niigatensis]|uniref:nitrous oxide reductase accessory protein NosL n=1 Tax=Catalinimonas niigatensis TaxID=1397264 RepID=UPI002666990E|nr:nitrous oxide reductase accessory protein NosL [Catalinimonas niigatensis]WPP48007.1 nitrous oxide reductase accessory protein NosL [Catalinimonas niigatensis]